MTSQPYPIHDWTGAPTTVAAVRPELAALESIDPGFAIECADVHTGELGVAGRVLRQWSRRLPGAVSPFSHANVANKSKRRELRGLYARMADALSPLNTSN